MLLKRLNAIILTLIIAVVLSSCEASVGTPDIFGAYGTYDYPLSIQYQSNDSFKLGKMSSDDYAAKSAGGEDVQINDKSLDYGDYPCILANDNAFVLNKAFAMRLLDMDNEQADEFVSIDSGFTIDNFFDISVGRRGNYGSTDNGVIYMYQDGTADCIISATPLGDLTDLSKEYNIAVKHESIAEDAIVFFTSTKSDFDNLDSSSITEIYSTKSKYTIFQREKNSTTRTLFDYYVMNGKESIDGRLVQLNEAMDSVGKVSEEYIPESNSIGYCTYSQFCLAYKSNPDIKLLSINGVLPSKDSILSKEYAFSFEYNYYYKPESKDKAGAKFLDYIKSNDGKLCIEAAGLIPLD